MLQQSFASTANFSGTFLSGSTVTSSNHLTMNAYYTPTEWIIDSGASDHITSNLSHLLNHVEINPLIHLPTGQTSTITHKGSIQLTPDLVLHDVLCVPEFKFNLISGSKLASQDNV